MSKHVWSEYLVNASLVNKMCGVHEDIAVLQPFDVFHHVVRSGNFAKSFLDADCTESIVVDYWQEYARSPWSEGHPVRSMSVSEMSKVLPIYIHFDGVCVRSSQVAGAVSTL